MINIKTNIINTIIEKNNNYGKTTIGNNQTININLIINNIEELLNIDYIRELIYIDNLERIFTYYGYTIDKYIYITNLNEETKPEQNYILNTKYKNINKILDIIRININKYIDKTNLQNITETTINKIKYTTSCYIEEDIMCIKNINNTIPLIDNQGNYTNESYNLSYHINKINKNYKMIIDLTKEPNKIENIKEILTTLNPTTNNLFIKKLPPSKIKQTQLLYLNDLINLLEVNTIRYFFSNKTIDKDIYIDIELALEQSNNNPIYYIEETFKKISSILEKNKSKIIHIDNYTTLNTDITYNMLNKLYEFNNIIKTSIDKLEPYYILNYIIELSVLFNSYHQKEIEDNNSNYTQESLNLILAVKIVLNNALDLIGIIPKEM